MRIQELDHLKQADCVIRVTAYVLLTLVRYRITVLFNLTICSKFTFISYLSYKRHSCTLPDKRYLSQGMCLYQVMMTLHFLNDIAYDAESTQKSKITS